MLPKATTIGIKAWYLLGCLIFDSSFPKGHFTQLGGQGISVVATSDHQDDALRYIKWFAQPKVQQKWWEIGGYSALKAVVDAPGFPNSAPFAPQFLESMAIVKDFWAEPSYAQLLLDMQKRVHDYVVADKGTAQQALDLLLQVRVLPAGLLDEGLSLVWRFDFDRRTKDRVDAWLGAHRTSLPITAQRGAT